MQRWEYCSVLEPVQQGFGFTSGSITYFKATGREQAELKRDRGQGDKSDWDAVCRTIGMLGQEGWEMIGAVNRGSIELVELLFKRPIG